MNLTPDSVLSLLGSLASLAAIPLSVYLYLRSREARVARIRREVVKILSYQIGEGRELTLFAVSAVISSKLREEGGRRGSILVEEVIEDLVAETIMEPMLDSARKDEILSNLGRIHSLGLLSRLVSRYSISPGQLARWASQEVELSAEDQALISAAKATESEGEKRPALWTHKISTFFGLIASGITVLAFIFSEMKLSGIIDKAFKTPVIEVLLGLLGSIVSLVLAYLVTQFREVWLRGNSERDSSEGKS